MGRSTPPWIRDAASSIFERTASGETPFGAPLSDPGPEKKGRPAPVDVADEGKRQRRVQPGAPFDVKRKKKSRYETVRDSAERFLSEDWSRQYKEEALTNLKRIVRPGRGAGHVGTGGTRSIESSYPGIFDLIDRLEESIEAK